MANKKNIALKESKVNELAEVIKGAKLILLVDYRGTTVADDTKLRKDLRESKGELKVIKNNIIKRALESNKETGLDDVLEGPTAMVSAGEEYLQTLKVVYKFTKEHENYKIKGGIIDGKVTTVEEIMTLATLPSREELLSKLAGSLLQTISKVAVAIDQVRIKKEAEGEAPAQEEAKEVEAPEAKAEEKVEEKEEVKVEATEENA